MESFSKHHYNSFKQIFSFQPIYKACNFACNTLSHFLKYRQTVVKGCTSNQYPKICIPAFSQRCIKTIWNWSKILQKFVANESCNPAITNLKTASNHRIFIFYLLIALQKVCRTTGPTACHKTKILLRQGVFEKLVERRKIPWLVSNLQPSNLPLNAYRSSLECLQGFTWKAYGVHQAVRMASL